MSTNGPVAVGHEPAAFIAVAACASTAVVLDSYSKSSFKRFAIQTLSHLN